MLNNVDYIFTYMCTVCEHVWNELYVPMYSTSYVHSYYCIYVLRYSVCVRVYVYLTMFDEIE